MGWQDAPLVEAEGSGKAAWEMAPLVETEQNFPPFDPEGIGYDYKTAIAAGISPDETGHWPSREPNTGQLLKGAKHETFYKTLKGEEEQGYKVEKRADGKYYSVEIPQSQGLFNKKWAFPGDNQEVPIQPTGLIQDTFNQYSQPLPTRSPLKKEWWTENLPQSVKRIVPQMITGTVAVPYNAAKKFTDPIYNALAGNQELNAAASDLWNAPKYAATEFANGLVDFVGGPVGLSPDRSMKEAWSDPAAAMVAVSPLARSANRVVAAGMPKDVAMNLTKKSLKFSPGIEPALQDKVAKTVLKNDSIPTVKSYNEFSQKIRDLNSEVSKVIEPVGEQPIALQPESWIKPLLEKAATSGEKSKYTAEVLKYLEEFSIDHPEATVGNAQKIKISINKLLESYEKSKDAGHMLENAGREDAMRAIANGLRGEIERYAPDTKNLNTQIHEMLTAKKFLKVAANKAENQPTFSGRDMITGGVAGMMTTNPAVGTAAMLGSRLLRDPRVQGKAAVILDSFSDFASKIKGILTPDKAASIVAEFNTSSGAPNALALPAPTGEVSMYQHIVDIAQTPGGMEFLTEKLGRTKGDAETLRLIKDAVDTFPTTNYPLVPVPNTQVYHIPKTNALGQ